jgi:transcription-repair coupling factor (superfamily II helicase)
VKTLKGEVVEPLPDAVVDLPLSAFLPPTYVDDEKARLNIYTRLANLTDPSATGDLMLELRDRYGELPEPALNLIYLVQLKLLAWAGGISKITTDSNVILLQSKEGRRLPADALRRKFGSLVTVGRTQVHVDRVKMGANWLAILQEIVDLYDENTEKSAALSLVPSRPSPAAPTATKSSPAPRPVGVKRLSTPTRRRS